MSFYKVDRNGTPRQRFESQCTRPREEVQHARIGNRLLQDTEPSFAYSIRRGSHLPSRRLNAPAFELTRDYAEQDSLPAPESSCAPANRLVQAGKRHRAGLSASLQVQ